MEVSSSNPSSSDDPISGFSSGRGGLVSNLTPLAIKFQSPNPEESLETEVKVTFPPIVSRGSGLRSTRVSAPYSEPVGTSKRRRLILEVKNEDEEEKELDPYLVDNAEPGDGGEPGEGGEPGNDKVVGHKEGTINLIKSFVTTSHLITMRKEFNIPLDVTLRVRSKMRFQANLAEARSPSPSQPFIVGSGSPSLSL
ncbi:hypothetical protein FNV43_RR02632 [Rhamnella rubrinervis]|uniref:Uncharacterized protein n=1 Tax=Rhamnella rubrinervis TaxID=2594499 RepID=A0A8K0MU29_9ROSA|nr:hypothetical protein FNV43_RR02632 [Rhamnella rubrinervis]